MTEDLRARTLRSPRPVRAEPAAPARSSAWKPWSRGRAVAVGGTLGLVGCLGLALALSGTLVPSNGPGARALAPTRMSEPGPLRQQHLRVVAAPVALRPIETGNPSGARAVRHAAGGGGAVMRPEPKAAPQRMSAAAVRLAATAKPLASHRLAPVAFGASPAFQPVAAPATAAAFQVAGAAPAKAETQTLAALEPTPGAARPASGRAKPAIPAAATAAVVEDHVETDLPDNGAEPIEAGPAAEPPANARAALERELALAIPTPTMRPFRKPSPEPLLGKRHRAPSGLLAYARPDAGDIDDDAPSVLERRSPVKPRLGAGTAIYDIAAATVYLPNGERLEAHSGLGRMRDDVRFVREKNRGPTPPHTYNLAMRESLFHGVAAIRLYPVGGQGRIHNRNGLLAHTYMLGPRGDSNGCVSFKDYKRFLAAFKRGEIKRLVVVASLDSPPARIASWFDRIKR
ncbi:hypothetical protein ASG43_04920 [Aureimonas sp. Leaf454]|uniref:tlde1 domain-containing protein n=1 Tax=Aureimonas sp. Leaf454 TaxID=1736381 RepID=UPI0006F5F097|nr:tlde1 domain-containing protein [Aureimonas sp. Leaf454]KQT54885.1 hypothetical protein ASG43_04920 [Aureimonas sp. Leaf454]